MLSSILVIMIASVRDSSLHFGCRFFIF